MIDATGIEMTEVEQVAGQAAAVALLQAVADPVRWEILRTLATRPACVCRLAEHVPIAANLLSYHLKVLRDAGLVTAARRGRWVDYALADDAAVRMRAALPDVVAAPTRCASGDLVAAGAVSS